MSILGILRLVSQSYAWLASFDNLGGHNGRNHTMPWTMSVVAGSGEQGYAGDGGRATQALLNNPFDLAFDPGGNLCFSDTFNHCIRRIDARGVISTIAGTGERGFAGDGGPATEAQMNEPYGIVIDRTGTIYVADRLNKRVRRIDG